MTGPSGSGKSTLCRCVNGLDLFGHLTVEQNITLAPVRVRGLSRARARERRVSPQSADREAVSPPWSVTADPADAPPQVIV
ncbi:hypothetical protein ACFY8K_35760 [Streptomyces misionensis]|uniref:hypothetical protein n=1 Tax=Streptomyces misionensis TaxID=67331 RepID=UPI0036B06F6B